MNSPACLLLVMAGGALGALCRHGANQLAIRLFGALFPVGTLAVNLAGCLLIGVVFGVAERSALLSSEFRLFFVTGFLGALTTFSSYGIETVGAARAGATHLALVNILANNLLGLSLVAAGILLARRIV